jgi:hypothetical protein
MSFLLTAAVLFAPPPPSGPLTVKTERELTEHFQAVVKDSRSAAKSGLETLRELVTDANFKSMGFQALDEVKSSELGVPFPVVLVKLDELKAYKESQDPIPLLHPIHRAIYPVMVKGEVRSGMEVHSREGKWTAASFGLANEVYRYADARKKHAGDDDKTTYFLVKVPALNEYYLGHQTEKGLHLLRIARQPDAKEKLESRPAAEALLKLVPFAKEHDGKSR